MRAFTLPRGGGGLRRDLTRTINHRATDSDSVRIRHIAMNILLEFVHLSYFPIILIVFGHLI